MPELPEVETTRRGLLPYAIDRRIVAVIARHRRLRWPVTDSTLQCPVGQTIQTLQRRAKYLIIQTQAGGLIVHLGMSGSLRVVQADEPPGAHDHIDVVLDNHTAIRLRDPRRFGALLWVQGEAMQHSLLSPLGIEPLSDAFDGAYLFHLTRCRPAIKIVLMNSHKVAGIGNIYANEALFEAKVAPTVPADTLSRAQCDQLSHALRTILQRAILAGGSSLRDFVGVDNKPGYFQQHYAVYGRTGQPCLQCNTPIAHLKQLQRSTFFCPSCQKS